MRFSREALHVRKKKVSVHLSKELRKELKTRSLTARVGDKAKVLKGGKNVKKKEGKIVKINRSRERLFIEGLTRKKADGKEKLIPIRPQNVILIDVQREDTKRL